MSLAMGVQNAAFASVTSITHETILDMAKMNKYLDGVDMLVSHSHFWGSRVVSNGSAFFVGQKNISCL